MNLKEVDVRLEELKKSLEDNQNRRTEVYSRIVGYYRSVKNWNKGKKEEFGIRQTFSVNCVPAPVSAEPPKQEMEQTEVPVKEEMIEQERTETQEAVETKEVEQEIAEAQKSVKTETLKQELTEAQEAEKKMADQEQGDLFGSTEDAIETENEAMQYRFYFRQDCPNCPPMKAYVSDLEINGTHIDVDQEEGLQLAINDNVYTAPTVILVNEKKEEVFRSDNVAGLEEFLSQSREAVTL